MPPSKGLRPGSEEPGAVAKWHERAWETYLAIEKYYGNQWGLYNENYPKQKGDGDASFLWPYDGMVSAIATLNRLGYDVSYADKVERYEMYRSNIAPGGPGYSSGAGGYGERYYDDNSIVGINLVEAYDQLKKPEYLTRCADIVKFLKSGIDNTFGGGLWWCEQLINQPENSAKGSNKPACANGFAQWFLLGYYEICPEAEKSEVL
ncbi:MAG: glycosyltransferase, partial [Bacteroidales bacterium]|nr:glycosyltransferase [Bacteroidales bacterium]